MMCLSARHRSPGAWSLVQCDWGVRKMAPPVRAASLVRRAERSDRLRLVDEHDRNVISNRIAQSAGATDKYRFHFTVLERPFALGTYENLEQLRRQTHCACSFGRR